MSENDALIIALKDIAFDAIKKQVASNFREAELRNELDSIITRSFVPNTYKVQHLSCGNKDCRDRLSSNHSLSPSDYCGIGPCDKRSLVPREHAFCGNNRCGSKIGPYRENAYCPKCGSKIDWDGLVTV